MEDQVGVGVVERYWWFCWRICSAASSCRKGKNAYRRPLVTAVASCSREQENTTAPPVGGLYQRRPNSGNRSWPPSNSSAFRLIETAKRRCDVASVVLSLWALKWPASA